MWIKKTFDRLLMGSINRKFEASDLADISAQEGANLRSLAKLFEILDRRPLFDTTLDHCIEVVDDILHNGQSSKIVRSVGSAVLHKVADEFDKMGYKDRVPAIERHASTLGERTHQVQVLLLMSYLRLTTYHKSSTRVVAAVVLALLAEVDHSANIKRISPLSMCVVAAHSSGNFALMENIIRSCTHDLAAILGFAHNEVLAAETPERALMLATRAVLIAQIVARLYPEYEPALQEAVTEEARRRQLLNPSPGYNVYREAVDAVRAEDWPAAVNAYETIALDQDLSVNQRAASAVFAEGARLNGDLLRREQDIASAIDRLIDRRVGQARHLVDLDFFCGVMLDNAVNSHNHGEAATVAIRIADLAGELRAGTAIRETGASLPEVLEDATFTDILNHDVARWEPDTLGTSSPDTSFVWVNIFSGETDDLVVLFTSTMNDQREILTTKRQNCDKNLSSIITRSIGETSTELADDDILLLSNTLFSELDHGTLNRLVIVPDDQAWNMPWLRLAPNDATAVTVAPSAAAFERVTTRTNPKPRRAIGVFDETLDGAMQERDKLKDLARRGIIEFDEAASYQELVDCLTAKQYDFLTIAVHGTSSDGLEYRMMLPESSTSPASLFQLQLPPIVVLGCCWSGQAVESPDAVATPVGCLSAGATMVIGGLWAINDAITGHLLSDVYESYCTGTPFAEAFKSAYANLAQDDRSEAAGLILANSSW
jgi:hypothetical protein